MGSIYFTQPSLVNTGSTLNSALSKTGEEVIYRVMGKGSVLDCEERRRQLPRIADGDVRLVTLHL